MGKRQATPGGRKSRQTNPQWHTTFLSELARTSNVAASPPEPGST